MEGYEQASGENEPGTEGWKGESRGGDEDVVLGSRSLSSVSSDVSDTFKLNPRKLWSNENPIRRSSDNSVTSGDNKPEVLMKGVKKWNGFRKSINFTRATSSVEDTMNNSGTSSSLSKKVYQITYGKDIHRVPRSSGDVSNRSNEETDKLCLNDEAMPTASFEVKVVEPLPRLTIEIESSPKMEVNFSEDPLPRTTGAGDCHSEARSMGEHLVTDEIGSRKSGATNDVDAVRNVKNTQAERFDLEILLEKDPMIPEELKTSLPGCLGDNRGFRFSKSVVKDDSKDVADAETSALTEATITDALGSGHLSRLASTSNARVLPYNEGSSTLAGMKVNAYNPASCPDAAGGSSKLMQFLKSYSIPGGNLAVMELTSSSSENTSGSQDELFSIYDHSSSSYGRPPADGGDPNDAVDVVVMDSGDDNDKHRRYREQKQQFVKVDNLKLEPDVEHPATPTVFFYDVSSSAFNVGWFYPFKVEG